MAARLIQRFKGFSGSEVLLMHKHDRLFVRKIGGISRNHERLTHLADLLPVSRVYGARQDSLDIEYVHGTDIRSWLINNPAKPLLDFLIMCLERVSQAQPPTDWRTHYDTLVRAVQTWPFDITREQLLARLPLAVPVTDYIGDLTLENIIATDHGFVLIDCQTSEWRSFWFDIAKLRQDLECHWFMRAKPVMLENKLTYIQRGLSERWPDAMDNSLLVLMLLRVFRYCRADQPEHDFLIKEINRLCK